MSRLDVEKINKRLGSVRFDSVRAARGAKDSGSAQIVGRGGRGEEAQKEASRLGLMHKSSSSCVACWLLSNFLTSRLASLLAAPRASRKPGRASCGAAATELTGSVFLCFDFDINFSFLFSCVATAVFRYAGGRAGNVQLRRLSSRCGRLPLFFFRGCANLIQTNPVHSAQVQSRDENTELENASNY